MAIPDRLGIRRVPGGFIAASIIGNRQEEVHESGHMVSNFYVNHFTSCFVPYTNFDISDAILESVAKDDIAIKKKLEEWHALDLGTRLEIMIYESHIAIDMAINQITDTYLSIERLADKSMKQTAVNLHAHGHIGGEDPVIIETNEFAEWITRLGIIYPDPITGTALTSHDFFIILKRLSESAT